ncbi:MAG: hypothetical protein CO105_07220 [Comamonadaceae bacterium CG_4_9_14_3_um_filter_60_33]|nr:MAG: hypothetical protein COZ09_10235 [Comamonadaceae bacterium CG_4_10_14_3_um_filter_60_42]PJB44054.1 MAG: hypothetical protein CO105_07220 [Comamonadaceae bacterium CG_4_9_14_3_um_filter_60_33]
MNFAVAAIKTILPSRAACALQETIFVNSQPAPIDQALRPKLIGPRFLAQYYRRAITLWSVIFFMIVGGIVWSDWQRQFALEVNLINQRVQESAVNLKAIIKAASDEITQLSSWANNFPKNAPVSSAHLAQKPLGSHQLATVEGEFSLDERAAWPPAQRLGQMLALSGAKQPRAGGAPSNHELGVAMLERIGDGLKTSDFLRWTYFNAASKDLLVVAPWAPKKDFLAGEPSIASFLAHAWTYEVATAGLPENNPGRQPYWTQAYPDQVGAGLMVSHGAPVYWGDEFVGVVATDLQLDFLNAFLRRFPDPEGVLVIANAQGQILGDRSEKPAGGPDGINRIGSVLPPDWRGADGQSPLQGLRKGGDLVFTSSLDAPGWTLVFKLPQATVNARVAKAYTTKFYLLLVLVLGAFVIQFVLWRMYVSPALLIADFVTRGATDTGQPVMPDIPGIWRPWFAAISRTFGERRHYLTQLQSSHDLLDQRVQERTHELLQANQALREKRAEAEQANLDKSRFLASASHDLRQPAHALGMFIDRLDLVSTDPQAKGLVASAKAAVREMQDMLDDMFDLSRLDVESAQTQIQSFPVSTLFDALQRGLANEANAKGLRFRVRPSATWLKTDPALLRRILLNLVNNSIRYTPAGSILVACRPTRSGTHARIEVWDSGIGIAPEDQQKVFQEFYQVANPQRDRRLGLGVGLSIVERCCRLLGLALSLRSALGEGTRVSVTVPLGKSNLDVSDDNVLQSCVPSEITGRQVMLIEDDAMGREAVAGMLAAWGYSVIAAESAKMAAEGLQKDQPPDIIISDLRLGDGVNGIEAVRMLRSLAGQKIPACVISGDTDVRVRQQVEAAGLILLSKPVRPAKLRSVLRHLTQFDSAENTKHQA